MSPARRIAIAFASLLLVGGAVAGGYPDGWFHAVAERPAEGSGTVVVPDEFLRPWDPVTVFFPTDAGPLGGGPEDTPREFVTMSPDHPGAWTWLDRRTLQFAPAEPWTPLSRTEIRAGGRTVALDTLMSPPTGTIPAHGSEGLGPVEAITLTFPERMDADVLARMVTIELRELPGLDGPSTTWDASDFEVKALEATGGTGGEGGPHSSGVLGRRGVVHDTGYREEVHDTGYEEPAYVAPSGDGHRYELRLKTPIPLGHRATVHFRLAQNDEAQSFAQVRFATAEPFRATKLGCGSSRFPIAPDGTRYAKEQAVSCGSGTRQVMVEFTATPQNLGPVEARNLVRFEPAVEDLAYAVQGRTLVVSGKFEPEALYRMAVVPTAVRDTAGRALQMKGESALWLHFPRQAPYLRWGASEGLVERFGPQTVPVDGRGHGRVDLRVHAIDPLDRSFWPFPSSPVSIDETARPPGPGEFPSKFDAPDRDIPPHELAQQIRALGSPGVSTIVDLPIDEDGGAARFGLDLQPHLRELGGRNAPGTYLVGIRSLDTSTSRSWIRLQVSDLSVTTVEEPERVRFVVTSLSTGTPVIGAQIRVEGSESTYDGARWTTFVSGITGTEGQFTWNVPGETDPTERILRIVVQKGDDTLVLDPDVPPLRYADNHWGTHHETWLQWGFHRLDSRGEQPRTLAHVFTERPVYRPEEEVHVKGWLRRREKGELEPVVMDGHVVVSGPGNLTWRYPAKTSATGAFYHRFHEDDLPTGTYRAHFESEKRTYGSVTWLVEAYRIPTFEAEIHAPETVPLDREFDVELTASYYAGGRVAGRPVRWRVTQYPYTWTPDAREGFLYSSDGRYSGRSRFDATPRFEKSATTDDQGAARIVLDPSIEPTAQPRSYVIEATVTGDDDQTVTTTERVLALPPFVLGVKVPRYVERGDAIPGELLVAGPDGELIAGQSVTVRVKRREWHSHLQASDFSSGEARYVTDVVNVPVSETTVTSGSQPTALKLPVDRAGVYVVELEAHDRLGRAQVVAVDLYVGGDEPVAWEKPQAGIFALAADKTSYDPGQTATIVLKSPFQSAEALVIVEAPEGNRYEWVKVRGGKGAYQLPIQSTWTPRVPVHVVLMRGRVPDTGPTRASDTDLGKPTTLASTQWLTVNPVENTVKVAVDHPKKAMPGQKVPMTIRLTSPKGQPMAGEVTLWLVDAAVLSLGTEQRLDPLPDFITPVASHTSVRDTRNLAFGRVPFAEMPGGDEAAEEEESPLDKATLRKDFKSVPFYEAAIQVGSDGVARVAVQLPDNLTNFKVRAKAVAGPDRFGVATSEIAVRLPVLVQPTLPRFVRPGDAFVAGGVARVVEGDGGAGAAEVRVKGATLTGPAEQSFTFDAVKATRLGVGVAVDTPVVGADGELVATSFVYRMGVTRTADGASDAFEVTLPVEDDRTPVVLRQVFELTPGQSVEVPAIPEKARSWTIRRQVLVSDRPALVQMAGGLDFFLHYPYGATEQRVSRARAFLALGSLRDELHLHDGEAKTRAAVEDALAYLPSVIDPHGLVANFPGSSGTVTLTAWTLELLVEAKEAGYRVDAALQAKLEQSLRRALRSDYGRFVDGESFTERTRALEALTAAGSFDQAYFAELSRQARFVDAEGMAAVAVAGQRGQADAATLERLVEQLSDGLIVQLYQGREVYGGLQTQRSGRSKLIWPSETRTVAGISRAMARIEPDHERLALLEQALVTLGREDGWGDTNTNAAAMLALADRLRSHRPAKPWTVQIGGQSVRATASEPIPYVLTTSGDKLTITLPAGGPDKVLVRVDTRYVPAADGGQVAPESHGFVVSRTAEKLVRSGPTEKTKLDQGGKTLRLAIGDVVEEHVQVVNPEDRYYVAVTVPLAAGMEPLNPRLATAPPEATPSRTLTRTPTYVQVLDDRVVYTYEHLPKGTFDFAFRTRASTAGSFVQPAARAEAMYDLSQWGRSAGARVAVEAK